jgi:hypothetical protein
MRNGTSRAGALEALYSELASQWTNDDATAIRQLLEQHEFDEAITGMVALVARAPTLPPDGQLARLLKLAEDSRAGSYWRERLLGRVASRDLPSTAAPDRWGRNPFHYAALVDDGSFIAQYLDGRIDPNARDDDGETPLHLAARVGAISAADALLHAGAQVDAEDHAGRTPLFDAVLANPHVRSSLVPLLLDWGADPAKPDRTGQTPSGIAHLAGTSLSKKPNVSQ